MCFPNDQKAHKLYSTHSSGFQSLMSVYSVLKLGYGFTSSFLPAGSQKLKSPTIELHI
jgi:hypothetical protein